MAHGRNWRTWPFDLPGWIKSFMDPYAHAVTVIDEEHRLVHDGMVFDCDHYSASIANGASLDVHLKVPAGCYPHLRALGFAVSDGPCMFYFYEAPTLSADGTELTPRNHNRNSTNTPQMQVFHTPTVTGVGTLLHQRFVPDMGGVGANLVGVVGSTAGSAQEFVLKPSTSYIIRMTNNSGAAIAAAGECLWYEPSYQDQEN